MPVTVTAGAMVTDRLGASAVGSGAAAGFRSLFYPSLKLGPHWFVRSGIQVSTETFFPYQAYHAEYEVEPRVLQLAVGYSLATEKASVTVQAGHLPSAFGSFPLRYDETANPMVDLPSSYGFYLPLRGDQLPCRVSHITRQRNHPSYVDFYCTPTPRESYGMFPVTPYGLPAAQVDFSYRKADARFQLTNSSPSNPQKLFSRSQNAQWSAGGGYTIHQGFRVGISAFRGPYLQDEVVASLPEGRRVRDFPAGGIGVDVQWARGRWSANAEWQRFQFVYPRFPVSPRLGSGYAEMKAIVTPRLYAAGRFGYRRHNSIADARSTSAGPFAPDRQFYELALGWRLNRRQLLKLGYQWVASAGQAATGENVLGFQFVTTIPSLSKAFR